jgi:hypothetical protein
MGVTTRLKFAIYHHNQSCLFFIKVVRLSHIQTAPDGSVPIYNTAIKVHYSIERRMQQQDKLKSLSI